MKKFVAVQDAFTRPFVKIKIQITMVARRMNCTNNKDKGSAL